MTRGMNDQNAARVVQREAGLTYSTALRLVRGEVNFYPVSKDCRVEAAMRIAGREKSKFPAPPKKCRCTTCEPAA